MTNITNGIILQNWGDHIKVDLISLRPDSNIRVDLDWAFVGRA